MIVDKMVTRGHNGKLLTLAPLFSHFRDPQARQRWNYDWWKLQVTNGDRLEAQLDREAAAMQPWTAAWWAKLRQLNKVRQDLIAIGAGLPPLRKLMLEELEAMRHG